MNTLSIDAQESFTDDQRTAMLSDVMKGLSAKQKSIPSRWLYDARGSDLFEDITRLAEYYPARTERSILRTCAPEIANRTASNSVLIEFGSGSSVKTELLLSALDTLDGYIPVDISKPALLEAKERLQLQFPNLRIAPIVADFCDHVSLPEPLNTQPRIGFFPGSTIGNLHPTDAITLLSRFANILQSNGRLIIGVDLQKDIKRLEAAYDDQEGITADFNLNLLHRLNLELSADFDIDAFGHRALYNETDNRIEMHLVSLKDQIVIVNTQRFEFVSGETIHTENSYKYTIKGFQDLAAQAGWNHVETWTDPEQLFSVHEFHLS